VRAIRGTRSQAAGWQLEDEATAVTPSIETEVEPPLTLNAPSATRPSSATTDAPSTSRFVIFNATLSSFLPVRQRDSVGLVPNLSKSDEQGLAILASLSLLRLRAAGSLQRAPAAAAMACACVPTFTLICFGLASSRFGMLSVSTPF